MTSVMGECLSGSTQASRQPRWPSGLGRSVEVLLTIYAKCIIGRDQVWFDRMARDLDDGQ
jgi:hypothetical protein